MKTPKCDWCGTELPDWQANVMVDDRRYTFDNTIDRLQIVCKPCTRKMKGTERDRQHHNLWELTWVRDQFVHLLGSLLRDNMSDGSVKWEDQAFKDFYRLAALRFPEMVKDPMTAALEEVEGQHGGGR